MVEDRIDLARHQLDVREFTHVGDRHMRHLRRLGDGDPTGKGKGVEAPAPGRNVRPEKAGGRVLDALPGFVHQLLQARLAVRVRQV